MDMEDDTPTLSFDQFQTAADMILAGVSEDHTRDGLVGTPRRFAEAYTEMFKGYSQDPEDHFRTFEYVDKDSLIVVQNIVFYSACEHHLLPFFGSIDIGYIPDGKILGLSKFKRVVDVFAKRFQVQERLGQQIADCIQEGLNPRGVMVVVRAQHLCMLQRGVQSLGSEAITSHITGIFKDDLGARQECMTFMRRR